MEAVWGRGVGGRGSVSSLMPPRLDPERPGCFVCGEGKVRGSGEKELELI